MLKDDCIFMVITFTLIFILIELLNYITGGNLTKLDCFFVTCITSAVLYTLLEVSDD